jgi:predicted metal-dependent phosphoesterase TrpH
MTGTIVDMHCHTTNGASDSALSPAELIEVAHRIGLTGVNVSEHDRVWDRYTLAKFREESGMFVCPGMEVSTDLGHVLAIGLPQYVPGIRRAADLRKELDKVGGFMIVAHPFRHWFDPVTFRRNGKEPPVMTPENMAKLEIFQLFDAIEVLNGANTARENRFALEVANYVGKPGTGGSDAHSTSGVGIYTTRFDKQLTTLEEMLAEMHARRFKPSLGLPEGKLRDFTLDEFVTPESTPQPG